MHTVMIEDVLDKQNGRPHTMRRAESGLNFQDKKKLFIYQLNLIHYSKKIDITFF